MDTEVLIIGAGPTGLMAANQLMRFGIDFILVDSKNGSTEESRAIVVTARSLEIYQQMGLAGDALKEGARINFFNLYFRGKRRAEVPVGEIGRGLSEFHYMLAFEQSKNEELLYRNLKKGGREVLWDTEFIELAEHENRINAVVKKDGRIFSLTARYMIACDGARSPVRHQLNFKFEGGTYENKFFVADTVMQWNLEHDRIVISPGDKNFCGFLPLNGGNRYRVLGTLPKAFFNKEDVSFPDIEAVIKETLRVPVSFSQVNWFSVYKLHHRVVDRFRSGCVFLAGDSAHVHSPAGGQGMNTGLQDAYNLAWKLAFVLRGYTGSGLLDTYNEERLLFARWLLKFTDRAFGFMTSDNRMLRLFRDHVALNLAGRVMGSRVIQPFLFKTLTQIWYSYRGKSLSKSAVLPNLKFRAGDRFPYFVEEDSKQSVYLSLTGARFHLLHVSSSPLEIPEREKMEKEFSFPVKLVEMRLTRDWRRLGARDGLFVLMRPDNYVACAGYSWNEPGFMDYLKNFSS